VVRVRCPTCLTQRIDLLSYGPDVSIKTGALLVTLIVSSRAKDPLTCLSTELELVLNL